MFILIISFNITLDNTKHIFNQSIWESDNVHFDYQLSNDLAYPICTDN